MPTIGHRVKIIREALGLTKEAFATRMRFSRNYCSEVELGKRHNPGFRFLEQLSALEKEAATMTTSSREEATTGVVLEGEKKIGRTLLTVDEPEEPVRTIPILSWSQAGKAVPYEQVPSSWEDTMKVDGVRDVRAYAVRLVGDSMEPRFYDGDIVVCSPSIPPRHGDLVVASLRADGVVFKLLQVSGDFKKLTLLSYNPIYPPMEFKREAFEWIHPVVKMERRIRR